MAWVINLRKCLSVLFAIPSKRREPVRSTAGGCGAALGSPPGVAMARSSARRVTRVTTTIPASVAARPAAKTREMIHR